MPIPIQAWKKRCMRFRYYASLWASTWEEGLILDEKHDPAGSAGLLEQNGLAERGIVYAKGGKWTRFPAPALPEFVIQIADYFLLFSLWRNFYTMDKHSIGYRIFNWHVAMMSIIIIGANQIMPFIALSNHEKLYDFIENISIVASGCGLLFWILFNNRKTTKYFCGER